MTTDKQNNDKSDFKSVISIFITKQYNTLYISDLNPVIEWQYINISYLFSYLI